MPTGNSEAINMPGIDDDETLRRLAAGCAMDYSAWPDLLPRMIARIEKIAHTEFPIPSLPPPPPPPQPSSPTAARPSSIPRAPDSDLPEHFLAPLPSSPTEPRLLSPSEDTNKENVPNGSQTVARAAPAPPSEPLPPGTLPPQLAAMLSDITSHLEQTFPKYPPHTIQRISELVINPKQHYRSLAPYLHALDRVVRVTSGLNIYPFPPIRAEIPGGQTNGVLEPLARPLWASPGSDEALGGALLTPIPWLTHSQRPGTGSLAQQVQVQAPQAQQVQLTASAQEVPAEFEGEVRTESTERIDGPNGVGSVETVSVSVNGIPSMGARGVSVTQGELLRQEQEAGLVPISQLVPSHHNHPRSSASVAAQQLQIQAHMHHQRALAQSQNLARASSLAHTPDPPSSTFNTVSTPSSTTLERESVGAATNNVIGAIGSVHSNNAEDERPHACGPEEIGVDDLGPQTTTTSTLPASTMAGSMRQGIDIQAAVGRKPLDISTLKTEEKANASDDDNKADIMEDIQEQGSTPKREADDKLGGSVSKKIKEDPDLDPVDADLKHIDSKPDTEERVGEAIVKG
ncbi:hypothetical protein F4802DRAFT_610299 [Xylaria palmicola]|nr:hypothetical protein F4802DRAFT_610299 [Xylaria palmicola]